MKFTVLGSGSTGNSVLICTEKTKVLVDVGLSAKETLRRLALVGIDFNDLDAVLITHEHSDHASGLRVFLNTVKCPVYLSGETLEAYLREKANKTNNEPQKRFAALQNRTVEIESSRDFRIGDIDFEPFSVPHDAADNFAFVAKNSGLKIATVLDLGYITTLVKEKLRDCDAIVIESNHSRDMLKTCPIYSWDLKQRILSNTGHLSNEDLSEWLNNDFDGTARRVVIAHLSQRANEPHLARLTAQTALEMRAPLFKTETQIVVSYHREPTAWINVSEK